MIASVRLCKIVLVNVNHCSPMLAVLAMVALVDLVALMVLVAMVSLVAMVAPFQEGTV